MILRHYSNDHNLDTITVDETYSGKVSSFSRNSYNAIATPRLFCYSWESETEPIVTKGRREYFIFVDGNQIEKIDLAEVRSIGDLNSAILALTKRDDRIGYSYELDGGLKMVCLFRGEYETQTNESKFFKQR